MSSNQNNIFLQQQNAPTFTALARSSRSFGNDLSNRNNNNKRPKDAVASGPVKNHKPESFEKRVTRPVAIKATTLHDQALATSTRATTTTFRTTTAKTVTATAPDSLANLPGSTKSGVLPSDVGAVLFSTTLAAPKEQPEQDDTLSGYQYTGKVDNFDEDDKDDPLATTAYAEEIYATLRARELHTSVKPTYMEHQPHINERMRAILVDWIVEVHNRYELVDEALYLTVSLLDHYLEKAVIRSESLQLVGIVCLWVASKYEDIYPPEIDQLVAVCDNLYTKREILDMERGILEALGYQVTVSTSFDFLVRSLTAAHADKEMVCLSRFLLEGTLPNYDLLEYLPSQLACAAVMIARKVSGLHLWSPTLLKVTEYREEDILPVARALLEAKAWESSGNGLSLRAIRRKYASPRFSLASSVALPAPGDL
eukprot:CAMPEP_0178660692 /NCGR_PEP_ID=MMETSP0698-20121128/27282_1 /TAXON_ID=265572 /ORGANISM="Extubocellulus spinifer, Strain CCMP396" /LENGTH=425 /DNA_ID=CAMNT_0020303409 /DNA_START=336 /DNA_END=1613 /DNA_ORIENTATION=-